MAYLTLRLADPQCVIDKAWTQEKLADQIKRVVTKLHSLTDCSSDAMKNGGGEDEDDNLDDEEVKMNQTCWF